MRLDELVMDITAEFDATKISKPQSDDPERCWAVTRFYSPKIGDFEAVGVFRHDSLVPGMPFSLSGEFEESKYGRQFRVKRNHVMMPTGREGTIAFLQQCPRIGSTFAQRLWDAFGDNTLSTLAKTPEQIVGKIPRLTAAAIQEASVVIQAKLAGASHTLPLLDLFYRIGFPRNLADQVLQSGDPTPVDTIRKNPFWLMRFPGVSFELCDKLRKRLKLSSKMAARREAAVICIMERYSNEVWVDKWIARSGIAELLSTTIDHAGALLTAAVRNRILVYHNEHVALPEHKHVEDEICKLLIKHSTQILHTPWPTLDKSELSKHQIDVAHRAFQNGPIAFLMGPAGSGKTRVGAAIIQACRDFRIAAAAPTGKAANRLGEMLELAGVNGVQTTTIHRLLGARRVKQGWTFAIDGKHEFIEADLVVIDEASMLTNRLALHVLRAIRPGTLVLFVGDPYQLPSVGRGTLLRDWPEFCKSEPRFTFGLLEEIHRNSGDIERFSYDISQARFQDIPNTGNLVLLPAENDDEISDVISRLIRRHVKQHPPTASDPTGGIQVLVTNNKSGPASKDSLNPQLRKIFNLCNKGLHPIFKVGDAVINLENTFYNIDDDGITNDEKIFVANGDLGQIVASDSKRVTVKFNTGWSRVIVPTGTGKGPLDHAYALTVHKAQGSQFPVVVFAASKAYAARIIMDRNLLYTALTRAEQQCIVVGKNDTLRAATKKSNMWKRRSFIPEWLAMHYKQLIKLDCK